MGGVTHLDPAPSGPGGPPAAPGVVVVPVPVDAAARAALAARVEALVGLEHPHLVAVRDAAATRPGALDVRYARGDAADLPTVLAARGRLTAPEAAGVLVPVAQALAALHSAGLEHGPLVAADVAVRPDGAAALRPRAGSPPEGWTAADDVRALAGLVGELLGPAGPGRGPGSGPGAGDDAGALRATLRHALDADPRLRPEAGTLAARVHEACPPAPLRLPDPATLVAAALTGARTAARGPAPAPARRRPRRPGADGRAGGGSRPGARTGARRARRAGGPRPSGPGRRTARGGRRLPVLLGGAALAAGVLTGAVLELRPGSPAAEGTAAAPLAASPTGSPSTTPSTTPTGGRGGGAASDPTRDAARPEAAAAALTQRRLDLLAGAVADVGAVDAPGSAAYAADAALRDRLASEGPLPVRPRATVHDTAVVDVDGAGGADGADAAVRVGYVVEAHRQRGAGGEVVQVPASQPRTAILALRWTAAGWRVVAVR